jgi:predicted MFS family arabinose efflux permease
MAINGLLIAVFEMAVVFVLERKQKNLYFISIGTLLAGLSFAVFNMLPGTHSLALTSMFIMTAAEMLSMPFMNSYWISRTDETNRGQYAGLYTAAWSFAHVAGPLTGSLIAQRFGFTTLWWVIAIISVVTAVGFNSLRLRTQRQGPF